MTLPIEPNAVVQLIEQYVDDEHRAAERADNKTSLDEDGIYRLHHVAAKVYALGFYDGTCVANERHNRRRGREQESARVRAALDPQETH